MVLSSPLITKEEQKYRDDIVKLQEITDLLNRITAPESPETMSTIKQIEANRRNAQLSTGPKTIQGKAAVAQNALTHGLYASTLLLPEEDPAQYQSLCQLYIENYHPDGLAEIDLLQSMVADKWELARVNLMKQGVYGMARKCLQGKDKKGGEESHPSAARICMEVGKDEYYAKSMARICQMEGRIQRHCERATRELRKLQQERANQPPPDPPAAPALQPEPKPPEVTEALAAPASPEAIPTPAAAEPAATTATPAATSATPATTTVTPAAAELAATVATPAETTATPAAPTGANRAAGPYRATVRPQS